MKVSRRQNWEKTKLGEHFRIKHGFAFKGEYFSDKGPYILLTPGNFKAEGGLLLKGDKEKYYIGDFPKEYLLKREDFLVVMTDLTQNAPILGSSAFIKENNKFLHNQRLGKIVELNISRINKVFLYYLFNSANVRDQIKASATGSTVRHTAPDRIYAVKVELPPLLIQRKIADILSAYDDLIENNTRRIAILEEMAQSLYQEWFVKFRFSGWESVGMVESEMGLVPEGWSITKLGDICDITMGQSPSSQFYNEQGIGLPFHQGVTDFGSRFPSDRVYCTTKNRIAEAEDILFSVRAPVGRLNIANKKIILGRGLCAIRGRDKNQRFIFQQLKDQFQEEDIIGNGSIFKSVTKDDVYNIKLIYPSADIVFSFERFVQPIFSLLEDLITKNSLARQTRDLLLPKLISGEIDVSSWVEGEPEGVEEIEALLEGKAGSVVKRQEMAEPIDREGLVRHSLWE